MKSLSKMTLCLCLLLLAACTHAEWDKERLHGQWKLVTIDINGSPDTHYKGDMFWEFQDCVIEMRQRTELNDMWRTFGNFSLDNGKLTLSFPDSWFAPRPQTHLPRHSVLDVVELEGKTMVLDYNNGEGAIYTYTLLKW